MIQNNNRDYSCRALIRVDGSSLLGMGHVIRCIAFGHGLERHGIKPVFVTRDYEQGLIDLIRDNGFRVETMPHNTNLRDDALYTSKFALEYDAGFIVFDLSHSYNMSHPDEYIGFFDIVRMSDKFMIAIDDFEKVDFPFHMQVVPYYGVERMNYKAACGTKLLLGLPYTIFAQNFINAARSRRVIAKKGNKLLVTMGGGDPNNVTLKVLKSLARSKIKNLDVKIVVGKCFSRHTRYELSGMMRVFHDSCRLYTNETDLASLMLWSDAAIISGGLTKYETAITGTPSIIITQFELEARRASEFEEARSAVHMGLFNMISEKEISSAVERLLDNFDERQKMSDRGRALVDGGGIDRIINEIPKGCYEPNASKYISN